MKRNIQKNTLSFMTSKSYLYLRTPKDIWASLKNEFSFTLDACASDNNHLLERYYTKDNSCLDKDWTNEVVYCHPMFDMHIGDFVKKAHESKALTVMLLPASTHTRYFHKFIYKNPSCEIRFLEKPKQGFNFGHDDGSETEIPKGKVGYIKPLMVVIFRNAPKPQDSPQVFSYACGHTSNAIIMNDTPLSMSAYLSWSSNEGRERTECFDCYLKRTKEAEPQTSQKKE